MRSPVPVIAAWLAACSRVADPVAAQPESTIGAEWDAVRRAPEGKGVSISVVYDGEGLVNAVSACRRGGRRRPAGSWIRLWRFMGATSWRSG